MNLLRITKAKPNPAGKDKGLHSIFPSQLAGEWVDIKNMSGYSLDLNNMQLLNLAYTNGGSPHWQEVFSFKSNVIPANKTIRIHSGKKLPIEKMHPEDIIGADYHVFTERNYVWNNKLPDMPCLYDQKTKQTIDQTKYNAPVPDGKILLRQGDLLI